MVIENKNDINLKLSHFADFNNTFEIYKNVFKTPNSLRHYIFYAKENGLDKAISRLGKKLIFDLDKLDVWLAEGGNKQ